MITKLQRAMATTTTVAGIIDDGVSVKDDEGEETAAALTDINIDEVAAPESTQFRSDVIGELVSTLARWGEGKGVRARMALALMHIG